MYSVAHWETDNQFQYWGIYPLMAFVLVTVVFQVKYLNKALEHFSTSIVTPLNFVFFSTATLVTSSVLNQGFPVKSAIEGLTIISGFLVIVIGVALLFQYNLKLNRLSQVRWIEDINTLDEVEEGEKDNERNPFSLMKESFPFHPKIAPIHYVRTQSVNMLNKEVYARPEQDSTTAAEDSYSRGEVSPFVSTPSSMAPLAPLLGHLQYTGK